MKNETTNVYVIYKFSNGELAEKRLASIKSENEKISFFRFEQNKTYKNWKKTAKEKMLEANLVLFLYDNEVIPKKNDAINIKWELELAKKFKKKVITIYSNNQDEIKKIFDKSIESIRHIEDHEDVAKVLFGTDYANVSVINNDYKNVDFKNGKKKILDYADWSMENLFTKNEFATLNDIELRKEYYNILLRQYEIMIETSENLIDRRNSMSEKFKTICITLISLVTASLALGNLILSGVACIFVGIIISIITKSWLVSLEELSRNNEGKFAVINAIEEKLPAKMFDSEYMFNKYKGIKTYSEREKTLPKGFKIIAIAFIVLGLFVLLLGIWMLIETHQFSISAILKF